MTSLYVLAITAFGGVACGGMEESDTASSEHGISDGAVDGDAHPGVVLVVGDINGKPNFRCSGMLLSPTVVLTAGHCTGEPGEVSGMRIFTESDVQHGNNTYPKAGGPNSIEASSWASHPLFTEANFDLHDVGVIHLSAPLNLDASAYGQLPEVDSLDALKKGSDTTFTAVGYGVQFINPAQLEALKIRMNAEPSLIQIGNGRAGSYSMVLSNNASTGGTCFGDSGGPNLFPGTGVIAGVTSFARNNNCAGTGGVFRLDRADVLDFIRSEAAKN